MNKNKKTKILVWNESKKPEKRVIVGMRHVYDPNHNPKMSLEIETVEEECYKCSSDAGLIDVVIRGAGSEELIGMESLCQKCIEKASKKWRRLKRAHEQ